MAQEVSQMIGQTVLCVLAACGLVTVLWVFLGARLLPLRPLLRRLYGVYFHMFRRGGRDHDTAG